MIKNISRTAANVWVNDVVANVSHNEKLSTYASHPENTVYREQMNSERTALQFDILYCTCVRLELSM